MSPQRPTLTLPQAFDLAIRHHQAGQLAEAEGLYRQILAVDPNHADALHYLGVIAQQGSWPDTAGAPPDALAHCNLGDALSDLGQHEAAVQAYRQALTIAPGSPGIHNNLAIALTQLNRCEEAVGAYREAIRLQPDYAAAHNNLGVALARLGRWEEAVATYQRALLLQPVSPAILNELGNALARLGRYDEGIAAYRHSLEFDPDFAEAHNNLGIALAGRGQLDEAVAAYRKALELKPGSAKAHHNLGNALKKRERWDEAIAAYQRALALDPNLIEAYHSLGCALVERGQSEEAIALFQRALALQPNNADTYNNLGAALRIRGRTDEAARAYRQALLLEPGRAEIHNNLGVVLAETGHADEAIAAYRRALELESCYPGAHNNLGRALKDKGQLRDALAEYRCALELAPDSLETHNNLGNALKDQGSVEEALAEYRRALACRPDFPDTHNNLGNAHKDRGELDEALASYRRALALDPTHAGARSNLIYTLHFVPRKDDGLLAEEWRQWNRHLGDPLIRFIRPYPNERDPKRRLRIGYVSPDFHFHVIGANLIPLFECHDHRNFEIFCYSGVVRPDRCTAEFQRRADHWRSTLGVSDETLAETIRRDQVDVLVDLTQHMSGNRLTMFARGPAPVQVSFAGYPDTTGVEAIGCRISDRWIEANASDIRPVERVHLVDSFWCYAPREMEMEVNSLPAVGAGKMTFGSLNNFCKINEPLLKLWAQVLHAVPDSCLVLLSLAGSHRAHSLEILQRAGIDARRVEFVDRCPPRAYLELYRRLDVVLDPFPYNGHTTSLDALWMGVPVVSLAGASRVSRGGASILGNLGLPELVAHSEDEYVRIAAELARDLPRLSDLRATLRARMESSVLMDAPRFARNIEAAYRAMWRDWCNMTA